MPASPRSVRPTRGLRAAAIALSAGAALAVPLTASAHVHVNADSTTSGSFSALTFRVPNESSSAGTVKVSVQLPTDTPFLYVSTKPVPGWTAATVEAPLPKPVDAEGTTITKAVRTVTWTAEKGSEIDPGEYQEFSLSVGPLPQPGAILLPTDQTYSDGKVVHWAEPTPASGEEPENPAPVLDVIAAVPTASTAPATSGPVDGPAVAAAAPVDRTARGLAGAALLVSLVGLGTAVISVRRKSVAP